jgi:hypothetical protein
MNYAASQAASTAGRGDDGPLRVMPGLRRTILQHDTGCVLQNEGSANMGNVQRGEKSLASTNALTVVATAESL